MASHTSNQEKPDDEVLNQENLGGGFFFANFLSRPFEKFHSSQKFNERCTNFHDQWRINLSAWVGLWDKRDEWEGAGLK
jgi:hypothetical protein